MYHILILNSLVEIQAETAILTIKAIKEQISVSLPNSVAKYLKSPYIGYNKGFLDGIEKLCDNAIKQLIDNGTIISYVDTQDSAFRLANDYALWALRQKIEPYKQTEDRELIAFVNSFFSKDYNILIYERFSKARDKGQKRYFINIIDLSEIGFPNALIPNNFVVWAEETVAGYILMAYSEFDKEYRKICAFRQ